MITTRGWWFLITVLTLLVLSLGTGNGALVLVSLTLLGWMLGNWLVFAVKLRLVLDRLRMVRELRDERGTPVRSLWSGQKAWVTAVLVSDSGVSLPFVWIVDRVPAMARLLEGNIRALGPLAQDRPVELTYQVECIAPGQLRFEGLRVHVADLQGFFQHDFFVRRLEKFPVYPPVLAKPRLQLATAKRHNALPLLGTHRHRRPGSGSELLDLREYLPGDPPKMIAWKASARRDRLMTKEFESEVPVRCTLLVDVSAAVRVGQLGENVLARLVEIAAAVVQASTRVKDLTGLCLFEESGVRTMIRPGRGPRHDLRIMAALTEATMLPLVTDHAVLDRLLPLAYGLAQEVYPDLLDRDVNDFPFWLPWWSPQPGYTRALPLVQGKNRWTAPWFWLRNQWRRVWHNRWQPFIGRVSGGRRRLYRWRKKLASLLAVRHGLGPGGLAMLLEDDQLCRRHVQLFLTEHQIAFPTPLYDAQGRYLFVAPEKIDVLVSALLDCVARGRDNELFVLLADVLEVGSRLDKLLQAIQVARARHHRVVVICPWPKEVPLPARADEPAARPAVEAASLQELFFQANTGRLQQAGRQVQRALAQLGVPVVFSPQDQAVSLILQNIQHLRIQVRGGP